MKIEAFRKIIREEVRGVIKEELSLIMSTPISSNEVLKKPVVEQKVQRPSLSELTETVQPTAPQPPLFDSNDPLAQMLNETAAEGSWRNINGSGGYTAQDAVGFGGGMPGGETKVVENVDQMLSGQQGARDVNQVSIDAVPDFSGLMSKMKEAGQI
tara:strand:- start:10779 stop:11246 length:468 start_codon:yes stop_codon:yes gene_type:complete